MKTHVLLYVEGETEKVLFPKVIQHYRDNFKCSDVVFHIENIKGVGNYKGKAKGKLQQLFQRIQKEGDELKIVICSYDTDVFEFKPNPPIDRQALKGVFEAITKKKNVFLMPIKHSIEDWLLTDIDGLCKYLRTKKKPRNLLGANGFDKMSHWFKQHHKVYSKGYECENIVKYIDVSKIISAYHKELRYVRMALGIKETQQ